jgi:hypothetical protein
MQYFIRFWLDEEMLDKHRSGLPIIQGGMAFHNEADRVAKVEDIRSAGYYAYEFGLDMGDEVKWSGEYHIIDIPTHVIELDYVKIKILLLPLPVRRIESHCIVRIYRYNHTAYRYECSDDGTAMDYVTQNGRTKTGYVFKEDTLNKVIGCVEAMCELY